MIRYCFLVTTFALLLGGCVNLGSGTAPTHYYLIPSVLDQETRAPVTSDLSAHTIAIGPITLAGHLDRPQLISRLNSSRLHLMDYDRWAEPLAEQIGRVLRENLAASPNPPQLLPYPWPPRSGATDQLSLEIKRFELQKGATALLVVDYRILDPATGELRGRGSFSNQQQLPESGPDGFVRAAGENLAALARRLAEKLSQD